MIDSFFVDVWSSSHKQPAIEAQVTLENISPRSNAERAAPRHSAGCGLSSRDKTRRQVKSCRGSCSIPLVDGICSETFVERGPAFTTYLSIAGFPVS